ncbi:hypothetical protein HPB48_022875 [Haemaphysalis longicornis]|uniref:Uncharacterized protein n=1 Tax=Haemaphysalis longicornis TaxID=44386 RepID=A0A9J6GQG6_HAELO|nr:hypothetical protein HPB48_022875 [Haemaphysalis longicornis]
MPTSTAPGLNKVSWSNIVAQTPTAHDFPPLPPILTNPPKTSQQTPDAHDTSLLPPKTSSPSETPQQISLSPNLHEVLRNIQQQQAALSERLNSLASAIAAIQSPSLCTNPPTTLPPQTLQTEHAAAILEESIPTRIIPLIDQRLEKAIGDFQSTITTTLTSIQKMSEVLTARITNIEKALASNSSVPISQSKKAKLQPPNTHDPIALATALPNDDV